MEYVLKVLGIFLIMFALFIAASYALGSWLSSDEQEHCTREPKGE